MCACGVYYAHSVWPVCRTFSPTPASVPCVLLTSTDPPPPPPHTKKHTRARSYHYNVNTSRLLVHVQKGWEDGLYISSVASCSNLWAIVMDAGTEFSQQIYKVHYNSFLPKVSGRGHVSRLG